MKNAALKKQQEEVRLNNMTINERNTYCWRNIPELINCYSATDMLGTWRKLLCVLCFQIEMEDKLSEGDYQKKREEDRKAHEEEIQWEMEEYERQMQKEERQIEVKSRPLFGGLWGRAGHISKNKSERILLSPT